MKDLFIGVGVVVSLVVLIIFAIKDSDAAYQDRLSKYGECGRWQNLSGCLRCEERGGIFYAGSFGADRCDFPPSAPTN